MVWETIGEQRIGANVPSGGNPVGNSYCLLPDRPSVGHFEHSRSRIKKLCQIWKIDVRPHVVSAEIVNGIKRSEINLSRDSLPGFNFQRRLRRFGAQQSYWLIFISGHLESKPWLSIVIVKFDIASGQICEGKGRYNRFVSDVLHSLEFQVHLNLPLCYGGKKENAGNARNASDQIP